MNLIYVRYFTEIIKIGSLAVWDRFYNGTSKNSRGYRWIKEVSSGELIDLGG